MTITDGYFDAPGARMHYLRAGTGARAIVLTHGNSHCGGVWRPLVEQLAGDEFTVIAWDLRGHGWSEKAESGYDWAGLRDDLSALVSVLDLRDVLFVGHSRGGGVSLLAGAATPDRARGVLVWEPTVPVQADADGRPAPVPEPARITALRERSGSRRDTFGSRAELIARYRPQAAFREWREDYFASFVEYGSIEREDGSVELCVPGWAAGRLYEATFGFDAWRNVHAGSLPVEVLFGDRSGRVREGQDPVAGIRTMFPRARSRMVANATHTGPMERPELFEQIVREFATGVWPKTASESA